METTENLCTKNRANNSTNIVGTILLPNTIQKNKRRCNNKKAVLEHRGLNTIFCAWSIKCSRYMYTQKITANKQNIALQIIKVIIEILRATYIQLKMTTSYCFKH